MRAFLLRASFVIRHSSFVILAAVILAAFANGGGCAFNPIATSPGSAIVAGNVDKAIQAQAIRLADAIDDPSKPYLHSVADALRADSGDIVNPVDVQRIVQNYGDPKNAHKFKQLGSDLWTLLENATLQYGKVKGTEIVASALNKAGNEPAPRSTVSDGP